MRPRHALAALVLAAGALSAHAATLPPEITVTSNRADLVSGGNAMVEIKWPAGANPALAKIALNGVSVNSSFALRANGKYMGLVSGLREGSNVLTARIPGGGAQITITNHSIGGPIFSGPQVQPWLCQTTNNPSLGPALDDKCNAPSAFRYRYRTTAGAFANYDPSGPRPANMATTTTDQGVTVDYIIRIERGTADRGIHEIAVLYDPTKPWTPYAPQSGWNGKLFIPFGSGCEYGHLQGNPGNVEYDVGLRQGFMVMSSSNTQYSVHCNDVLAAETVMMLKEHITENYGPIRYTMSNGVSGGSHLQNLINTAYPGLLQGSIPGQNFEDTWTVYREFSDCGLLARLYASGGIGAAYTEAQKAAIDGHANASTCAGPISTYMASRTTAYIGPSDCGSLVSPASAAYNPVSNVNGERCTQQDYQRAVFGLRESDGFAKRPLDSVGVQYGLVALLAGTITPQMFVDVNSAIGCWDIDQNWVSTRCVADPGAVEIAHRTGRVATGHNHKLVAMIESRDNDYTEEHFTFRSIVSRNRLLRDAGTADSRAIWRIYTTASSVGGSATTQALPFDTVNQWLANVEADTSPLPLAQKILANRPALAKDRCVNSNGTERPDADCDAAFVVRTNVRVAAGEVATSDVMKCQLKPMSMADYPGISFTPTQWAALSAVFPGGVCDYSKPGIGQVEPTTWLTFKNGPGGEALGAAPVSQPIP
jgi:hypothetical protein